jgi:hypothetical protein
MPVLRYLFSNTTRCGISERRRDMSKKQPTLFEPFTVAKGITLRSRTDPELPLLWALPEQPHTAGTTNPDPLQGRSSWHTL